MGSAMLRGLIGSGSVPAASVHAADLDAAKLQTLAKELGLKAHPDALEAVKAAQIVVLATKPQGFAELLPVLAPLPLIWLLQSAAR
jgi:pyrroline-5-carboxylate reductase